MTADDGGTTSGPVPAFDRRATSPWTRGRRGITTGMVGLIGLTAFEALAVTTAMPVVVEALGGLELYAMAFAAPAAASILGVVAAGSWADRSGPRSPLLAGVAAFVLGLVIAGTATGMPVVVAGRAIQGLGAGALVVALYVVVAQVFPATVQPRVFAAFAAAWVVPSIVGPAAAGWLAEHVGWRWVFLAVPILAVPAMATLRPVLAGGTRPPSKPRAPGERGRLLRGLGAGVAALALHWGGQQDLVVAAITGVVGLTLLVVTVPGLLPRGTFRFRRGLPSVVMLRGVFGTAFFAAEVYLPLLLTTERGLRPGQAGLVLTVAAITWSLGSWVRGRSEGRWSDAGVLRVGALALALGIASVALAVWSAVPVLTPMLGWGLSGFGMGLAYPTTSLLILRLSEPDEVGVNSAALQVNEALCIAVTLAASGPAFAQIIGASASAAFLTVLALPIVLALAAALTASRVTTPQRVT